MKFRYATNCQTYLAHIRETMFSSYAVRHIPTIRHINGKFILKYWRTF